MCTPRLVYCSTIFLCAAILLLRVFQLVHLEFIKWNLLECTVVQSKDINKVCWMLFKQLFLLCMLRRSRSGKIDNIITSHFNFPASIHRSDDVCTRVSEIELNFIHGNMRNFSNKTAIVCNLAVVDIHHRLCHAKGWPEYSILLMSLSWHSIFDVDMS